MDQLKNLWDGILDSWEEGSNWLADNVIEDESSTASVNPHSSFIQEWSKNYQTDQDPVKEQGALDRLNKKWTVPEEADISLKKAASIFKGDSGFTEEELYDYGAKTGQIESRYITKVQDDDGPARSYWQVEPETALDLLNNSPVLFGGNFEKMFSAKYGQNARKTLANKTKEEMSNLLLEDSDLAATLSLGTYVRNRQR